MSLEEQKNSQTEQIKEVAETTESSSVAKIESPEELQELIAEKTAEAEKESDQLITQGNVTIENKVKNLGLTPSYIEKGKQMLGSISQKIRDNFNKFTSKLSRVVPLAGMVTTSIVGPGDTLAQGAGSPEKTKVYTDKAEYENALQAYNDSLLAHNITSEYIKNINSYVDKYSAPFDNNAGKLNIFNNTPTRPAEEVLKKGEYAKSLHTKFINETDFNNMTYFGYKDNEYVHTDYPYTHDLENDTYEPTDLTDITTSNGMKEVLNAMPFMNAELFPKPVITPTYQELKKESTTASSTSSESKKKY